MDGRAQEEANRVRAEWGEELIRTVTGWPLLSGLPLQHIAWFKQNCPAEFAATRHFLFVNDFISLRLTGRLCMNPSDASITQLLNLATSDWDERLLDTAGIERGQLSPIRASGDVVGHLSEAASQMTGLSPDTLVVNGAHDQYCAAIGTGVTRPGRTLLSCGTAWVMLAVPESLEVGLRSSMAISCHAILGRWGAIRSLGAVGTSLEWLLDHVWGGQDAGEKRAELYDVINQGVARTAPGAGGLLFFPLAGGHASGYGPARGGFLGLSISHARYDMARAVMEGAAFELRWATEEMQAKGLRVAELTMVGGAAKSAVWPQIIADITGVTVTLPSLREAASRGAAILAGVGAGLFTDPETGFGAFQGQETRLEPDAENQKLYDALFAKYQRLAQVVAGQAS
jgi:xylulokinase